MSAPEQEAHKSSSTKYAKTGIDKNRQQLERLMKDPSKLVVLPEPPKEKTIRPPREMVKNVQGSSAGAGSGEFHVYKASRRREYERLKLMEDQRNNEVSTAEMERKRREREEDAEAKTAKNRAKRQKKKAAAKLKGKNKPNQKGDEKGTASADDGDTSDSGDGRPAEDQPFKKRRLVAPVAVGTNDDLDQADVEADLNTMPSDSRQPVMSVAISSVVIHDED